MIPPKVILEGDTVKAEELRAFALSQLRVLHRQSSFDELKQDSRVLTFSNGSRIEVTSRFGLDTVSIYVPEAAEPEVEEPKAAEVDVPVDVEVRGGTIASYAGPVEVFGCIDIPDLVWNPDNSEGGMERGSERTLFVSGGAPATRPLGSPLRYYWRVSGKGYWFDEEYTSTEIETVLLTPSSCEGRPEVASEEDCEADGGVWVFGSTKTKLYSDGTICGPATVTVTDICENEASGQVPYENQLEWADDNPAVVERGEYFSLRIVGGETPYTWRIAGDHFWFDEAHTLQETVTSERNVRIYVDDQACDPVSVEVEDDCEATLSTEIALEEAEFGWKDERETAFEPCAGGTVEVEVIGGVPPFLWSISGEHFTLEVPGQIGEMFYLRETPSRVVTIHASEEACGESGTLTVSDVCGAVLRRRIEVKKSDTPLTWDSDYSDDEIDQSESNVPIGAIGGVGPYTWEVSPSDKFTLGAEVTDTPTNTLSAEADACGTAVITITDCCGESCTGRVLCTTGQWVEKSTDCELSGSGTEVDSGGPPPWYDYELVQGYQKQAQRTVYNGHFNDEDECPDGCEPGTDCIGDGTYPVPCVPDPPGITCWKVGSLSYQEWEC